MEAIRDWRGEELEVAASIGGTLAVADIWRNVIRTGIRPWPPPELVQKTYKSEQESAFAVEARSTLTKGLGYYCDLQSINSEDALTWSVFGPVTYAAATVRRDFVRDLFGLIGVGGDIAEAHVWLWRRIPHPDKPVSGGPEIDFGVYAGDVLVLGEAKWFSSVGEGQGANRDENQFQLRAKFLQEFGRRVAPSCKTFVVLGLSGGGGIAERSLGASTDRAVVRDITWGQLAGLASHPVAEELRTYLDWKSKYSSSRARAAHG